MRIATQARIVENIEDIGETRGAVVDEVFALATAVHPARDNDFVEVERQGAIGIVENKIDFGKARNVIIAAIILVLSIGIQYCASGAIKIPVGKKTVEQTVEYFNVDGEKYVIDGSGSVNIPADAIAKAGSPVKENITVEEPLVVISLSGLAVGSLIGIILNAVLPGKDYVFEDNQEAARAKDSTIIPDEKDKKKKKDEEEKQE